MQTSWQPMYSLQMNIKGKEKQQSNDADAEIAGEQYRKQNRSVLTRFEDNDRRHIISNGYRERQYN